MLPHLQEIFITDWEGILVDLFGGGGVNKGVAGWGWPVGA